jgi:hypothetical protein
MPASLMDRSQNCKDCSPRDCRRKSEECEAFFSHQENPKLQQLQQRLQNARLSSLAGRTQNCKDCSRDSRMPGFLLSLREPKTAKTAGEIAEFQDFFSH